MGNAESTGGEEIPTPDANAVEALLEQCAGAPGGARARLDAEAVTLLLWRCRADPAFVAGLTQWLAANVDREATFDGIELYLPQLAHMIIHFDGDWPSGVLESFALVVAQHSVRLSARATARNRRARAENRGRRRDARARARAAPPRRCLLYTSPSPRDS